MAAVGARSRFVAPVVLAMMAAVASERSMAQVAPLIVDVRGGSMPGAFEIDIHDGNFAFEPCILLMGVALGPTPISIVDPTDPRTIALGLPGLQGSFLLFGQDLHTRLGPFPLAVRPSLYDLPFYFQALTFGGATTFFDRVSFPAAMRPAPAGAFRARQDTTLDERAFGLVLPRVDGRWMIAGGGRGALLAQVAHATTEIYDDLTDAFVYGPTMTTERSLHQATLLNDGRWLLTGGVNRINDPQALCEVYDPATDTFAAVTSMLSPRMGHSATLLPDGRVFVAGGLAAMTVTPTPINAIFDTTNTTEIYDPTNDTWTAGPNMSVPRAGHVAVLRPNGQVLLAGGISWSVTFGIQLPTVRSSADLFTPGSPAMSGGPGMSTPHSLVDAVPLGNDRWLVAGGITSLSLLTPGVPTAQAEIYDAAANTWSSAGAMAAARGNHRTFALGGGRYLAVGGADGTILAPNPLASGEIYDAGANTWSPGPSLSTARAGAAGFLTPRGQFHVIGGGTTGNAIARSCEWYYF